MRFKKYVLLAVVALGFLSFTVYNNDYFEIVKQIEIFTTLYKKLNTSYVDELNHGKLMTTAINKMLEQVDPYTVFYNEQDNLAYRMHENKYHTQTGMDFIFKGKRIFVKAIERDSPADKARLKPGDEIVSINNTSVEDFGSVALNLLKSPSGTKIDIVYKRLSKTQNTTLTMATSRYKSVPFFKLIKGDVGYIVLTKFSRTSAREVEEALKILKIEGAKSVVLDLRNNPGGLLDQAVDIVNLFVAKKQSIVTTKSRIETHNNSWYTRKEPLDMNIPIAVLINGASASASEIVSGSLQDLDRGVLVGSRSFGKGLVQVPMELVYGTQLKVTISRYYTPSGRCIQKLDYSNRDAKGKAKQVDYQNAFKTKKGRTIYDGGGITPDVSVSQGTDREYLNELKYSLAIFEFATRYSQEHHGVTLSNFDFTPRDFERFRVFFKKSKDTPKTEMEMYLENQLEEVELSDSMKKSVRELLAKIREEKIQKIDENKEGVVDLIKDQILSYLFYKEDIYKYKLENDKAIKKAVEILKSPNQYKALLTP